MRRTGLLMLLSLCLTGCVRGCTSSRPPIHLNPNMDRQPKYLAQEASDFFYDGATMREPIPGTVALDDPVEETVLETGKDATGAFVAASPIAPDETVMARGEERYRIYCAPCHTDSGNGQGILFERGKVPTADLALEKYRVMPDGQIFDTITNGFGLMPGYRWPIGAADRWAIVAHVRKLQSERGASMPAAEPPPPPAPAAEAPPAAPTAAP